MFPGRRRRGASRAEPRETRILVELFYDEESKNWGFRVPSLNINGGADTREQALETAADAVVFALSASDDSSPVTAEREYLHSKLVLA